MSYWYSLAYDLGGERPSQIGESHHCSWNLSPALEELLPGGGLSQFEGKDGYVALPIIESALKSNGAARQAGIRNNGRCHFSHRRPNIQPKGGCYRPPAQHRGSVA